MATVAAASDPEATAGNVQHGISLALSIIARLHRRCIAFAMAVASPLYSASTCLDGHRPGPLLLHLSLLHEPIASRLEESRSQRHRQRHSYNHS